MAIFQNILVGLDGSKDSYEALNYASKIAVDQDAKLTVLYVITVDYIKQTYKGEEEIKKSISQVDDILLLQARTEEIGNAIFQKAKEFLDKCPKKIDYKLKMRNGNPRFEFFDEIMGNGYDLCVLGYECASASFSSVFGSTWDYLLKNTKIPILLIRAP
ncbi:MAG: universal stress protein [Promethearchaeia archaeon]